MRRFLQFAWGRQPGKTGNFKKIDNSLEKAKRFWCLALVVKEGERGHKPKRFFQPWQSCCNACRRIDVLRDQVFRKDRHARYADNSPVKNRKGTTGESTTVLRHGRD